MKVVSINVGTPRELTWKGRRIRTAIFKSPVATRVAVRELGLEGDGQADLRVHGGTTKAVYIYPREHYAFWQQELEIGTIDPGAFGENVTTEGLDERDTRVGDRLRIGSSELVVTEPRLPCRNLAMRFDRPDLVKRFLASGRTGFYLSVAVPGEIGRGDAIEREPANAREPTISQLVARERS